MKKLERPNIIKVYLSDEEKTLLEEKVRISDMVSTTAYIRNLIRYGFVYTVDYDNLKEVLHQLSGAANNINQIAHKANITNSVVKSDVEALKKEIDEIWRIVRSMLYEQPLVEQ